MSNRERWIVYPLLFFALMLGLADKLVPEGDATFARVRCGELTLVSPAEEPLLAIRPDERAAAEVVFYGRAGQRLLELGTDYLGEGARVRGVSSDGGSQFELSADRSGPRGEWSGSHQQSVVVGFDATVPAAGLWAITGDALVPTPDVGNWGVALPPPHIDATGEIGGGQEDDSVDSPQRTEKDDQSSAQADTVGADSGITVGGDSGITVGADNGSDEENAQDADDRTSGT